MRLLVAALAIAALTGCTIHYMPEPSAEELIVVPMFKPGQPITVVNKTAPREVLLRIAPYDLQVDLQKYADSAIQLLRSELERRGATVQASATREIGLDFNDVRVTPGAGRMRCVINATVSTGDGYVRGLEASGVSWNFRKAIDGAIVDMVKAVLTNDKVRSYLGGP